MLHFDNMELRVSKAAGKAYFRDSNMGVVPRDYSMSAEEQAAFMKREEWSIVLPLHTDLKATFYYAVGENVGDIADTLFESLNKEQLEELRTHIDNSLEGV